MNVGAAVWREGENIHLRAAGSDRLHHQIEPHALRKRVLEVRRYGVMRAVAGHQHVQRMADTENHHHAERELGEQACALGQEQNRDHVDREEEEISEVEEREPLGGEGIHDRVHHHGGLHTEQQEIELIQLLIERLEVHYRQQVRQEKVAELHRAVDAESIHQRREEAVAQQAASYQQQRDDQKPEHARHALDTHRACGPGSSRECRHVQADHEYEYEPVLNGELTKQARQCVAARRGHCPRGPVELMMIDRHSESPAVCGATAGSATRRRPREPYSRRCQVRAKFDRKTIVARPETDRKTP